MTLEQDISYLRQLYVLCVLIKLANFKFADIRLLGTVSMSDHFDRWAVDPVYIHSPHPLALLIEYGAQ